MAWQSLLDQAQADLRTGNFYRARHNAELLLRLAVPPYARSAALLAAGDAAYELRSYDAAAGYYRQILTSHKTAPEVPSAAFGLGWAELRQGNRPEAVRVWTRFADTFASDTRAPFATDLAGEVGYELGYTATADTLFERTIARYPSSPFAGAARVSRALLALRAGREDAATRQLDELVRFNEPQVLDTRAMVIDALTHHEAQADLEGRVRGTSPSVDGGSGGGQPADPIEPFVARVRNGQVASGQPAKDAPYLIHGFVLLGATRRGWSDTVVARMTGDLADGYPSYPPAPALLSRVAEAAAANGQWPLARRVYEKLFALLIARSPNTPPSGTARVEFAEALFRTGAVEQARAQCELAANSYDDAAPRALLLLAQIDEAGGRRRDALASYDRLLGDYPRLERSPQSLLAHAGLLEEFGERARAREVLARVVRQGEGEITAEAAYRIARSLSAERQHAAALEWYLSAAYLVPSSKWSRPSLQGAGQSLIALGDIPEAISAYRKLLPQDQDLARSLDSATSEEAAFRIAETFYGTGEYAGCVNLYLAAASLTKGTPAERRALVGAVQCEVARGDAAAAQALYERLRATNAEPDLLAVANRALRNGGTSANGKSASDHNDATESSRPATAR
jgi:TolA-binding protein